MEPHDVTGNSTKTNVQCVHMVNFPPSLEAQLSTTGTASRFLCATWIACLLRHGEVPIFPERDTPPPLHSGMTGTEFLQALPNAASDPRLAIPERITSVFQPVLMPSPDSPRCWNIGPLPPGMLPDRFFERFSILTEQMGLSPDTPICRLPFLAEEERHLLECWAGDRKPIPNKTVLDLFRKQVEHRPKATALEQGERAFTYLDLDRESDAIAAVITGRKLRSSGPVAVCMKRGIEWVCAILGILKAGRPYLSLDPAQPDVRIHQMLSEGDIDQVVGEPEFRPRFPSRDFLDIADCPPATPVPHLSTPEDPAYVIFTSGSTGTPKGIAISHAGLRNLCDWHIETFGLSPESRSAHAAGLGFDAAVWELWPSLCAGATLRLMEDDIPRLPESLRDWFMRHVIDTAFLATPIAEGFITLDFPKNYPLKTLLTGGDRLRKRPSHTTPFRVVNNYGPSEASVVSTSGEVASDAPGLPHIGRPIRGTIVRILDENRQLCAPGTFGELCIGGNGLMLGYLHRPDLTQRVMIGDPVTGLPLYATGDLARFASDGVIEYQSRKDDQIQIHGVRIEPGEVEAALLSTPGVEDGILTVLDDSPPVLMAHLVLTAPLETVRTLLSSRLPAAMMPGILVPVPEIPLTPNGKPDRARLPRPERVRETLPETDHETRLADLFAECLSTRAIFRESDFFRLGGHSLLAARLVEEIARTFGVRITLRDVLISPCLKDIARKIEASDTATLPPLKFRKTDSAKRHDPFPQTEVQRAYWMGRRPDLPLGGKATHLYLEIETPHSNTGLLSRAFDRVIATHEMLRAVFNNDGTQQILEQVPPFEIPFVELSSETDRLSLRQEMAHAVLSTDTWPLFDIRLSRSPENIHRLHLHFDALILDYNGMLRVVDQWTRLIADPEARLLPPSLSFRDYALALSQLPSHPVYEKDLAFWRKKVPHIPPCPALPLAVDPASLDAPPFRRHAETLPASSWSRLRARCAEVGCTPSSVLLAAYAEILRRWSSSRTFTLNLTLFNPLPVDADLGDTVGDFTSLTLLSCHPDGADFLSRCRNLQNALFDALDHPSVSGLEVLKRLPTPIRQQGMPVVFTSGLGMTAGDGSPLDSSVFNRLGRITFALTETPQVWIDCQVTESEGALLLSWDVPEGLFPEGMVRDMFDGFASLVTALSQTPDIWNSGSPVLLPERQKTIRERVNRTGSVVPSPCLHHPFFEMAKTCPKATAILDSEVTLSYTELASEALALSLKIAKWNIGPGDIVALSLHPGWRQAAGVLAIHLAGAAYLPIDPALPELRRRHLLEQTHARGLLTDPKTATLAWPDSVSRLVISGPNRSLLPHDKISFHPAQSPEDLAYVIFTSGSTGAPKGVMMSHAAAWNTIRDVSGRMEIVPEDRMLCLSALHFDLSVFDIFGTLARGAALVYPEPELHRDPGHWCQQMVKSRVSLWNTVPALMQMLLDYNGAQVPSALEGLHFAIFSGDRIPTDLPERIRKHAPVIRLAGLGGATEAAIWSNWFDIGVVDPSWESIPYGTPLSAQRYHVLDRDLQDCPEFVRGNLHIAGAGLAMGYFDDPKRTAERFFFHPETGERLYWTGDLASYDAKGILHFRGRVDDQVKIRGHRIEPGETEAALRSHPQVNQAIVAPRPGPAGQIVLVGWFVPDATGIEAAPLFEFLHKRLPAALVPETLIPIEALPLSPNGKVDRNGLPAPVWKSARKGKRQVSELERELGNLLAEALGIPEVDPATHFFELGADSFRLVRFQGILERRFGKRLPIVTFFTHSSISRLARHLQSDSNARPEEDSDRMRRRKARRHRIPHAEEKTS